MITLTLRQMQYFQALAESRHFGRAAKIAGISQPALSAQIAEMENRLSCLLFERGHGTVRLTEEGQAILPRIRAILADVDDMEADIRRGREVMAGRFRLGIIPTVAPYLLPHVLPEIKRCFPALQIELKEAVTDQLTEDAETGGLDAFIAALPIESPGIVAEPLFDDRFFLAVAADDHGVGSPPVPPEGPALERLMLLEEGHCLRDQALAVCGQVKPVAMARYGATSLTTLLQMVAHGMGVTLIPEMAIEAAAQMHNLRIVPFAEPMPARTICLAWRRNGPRRDECRLLAELIATVKPFLQSQPKPTRSAQSLERRGPHLTHL